MGIIRIFLIGVGLLVLTAEGALAAPPTYCALYAREYGNLADISTPEEAIRRIQDQAYYRCLNQDEDPPLPTGSAYVGARVDDGLPPTATRTANVTMPRGAISAK
jgi:hypothetical protein